MKTHYLFPHMIILMALTVGCQDRDAVAELEALRAQANLERQNKELVLKWYEEIDKGNLEAAMELFHPDFRWYTPSNNPDPMTKAGAHEFLAEVFAAFPKWNHRIDDIMTVGDKVILRTVDFTRHEGEFMGIPAAGNDVEFSVLIVFRIEDGQISEIWQESDFVGWMSQIGMELKPKEGEQ